VKSTSVFGFGLQGAYVRLSKRSVITIENSWQFHYHLSGPEVFEWVAEWYCEHIAEFIKDDARNTFCVDDIHNEERVRYQGKAVCEKCGDVLDMATGALAGVREAQRFADLDSWLEALHAGKLEWDGPSERVGYELVEDLVTFVDAARTRRRTWPRLCRTCSTEFTPDRANAKNCIDCRAKRRSGAKHGNATG